MRRFALQTFDQAGPTHLAVHPGFEKGLGGVPEVELGVELAAQALDVEQGFLQQHQLRLDFDVEATRGLEQPHQHLAQRDVFERPVEMRLADGTDGALQRVDPGIGRHPARFDVQLGHAFVVAAKEGQEVLRQVFLVPVGQRADDAEIQRDVAAETARIQADHDVARVHVGMEEAVAKDLGEEDGDAVTRQLGDVDTGVAQALQLADGHAVHALHHHHRGSAEIPHHLGHQHQIEALHVAAQLGGVGGFAYQVEFVVQVVVELGHHLAGLEPLAVGPGPFDHPRQLVQQLQVVVHHLQHAGAQHFHRHFAATAAGFAQRREMHLGDRRTGHRRGVELFEHLVELLAEGLFDQGHRLHARKRRHPVLQQGQFVGHVQRQQVTPGRQHLTELDEDGAEFFQRHAQARAARGVQPRPAADGGHPHQSTHPALAKARQGHLVQAEAQDGEADVDQPKKLAHGINEAR